MKAIIGRLENRQRRQATAVHFAACKNTRGGGGGLAFALRSLESRTAGGIAESFSLELDEDPQINGRRPDQPDQPIESHLLSACFSTSDHVTSIAFS